LRVTFLSATTEPGNHIKNAKIILVRGFLSKVRAHWIMLHLTPLPESARKEMASTDIRFKGLP
jgi:hypothetical protein